IQSELERKAIKIVEDLDCVEFFTANDRQIGLIVPYQHEGHRHNYEPDFVVRLQNARLVMLEIKGIKGKIHNQDQVLAKNAEAKKWVAAVNNLRRYGEWVFEFCEDVGTLKKTLESRAGVTEDSRPFSFIEPTEQTAWKECV